MTTPGAAFRVAEAAPSTSGARITSFKFLGYALQDQMDTIEVGINGKPDGDFELFLDLPAPEGTIKVVAIDLKVVKLANNEPWAPAWSSRELNAYLLLVSGTGGTIVNWVHEANAAGYVATLDYGKEYLSLRGDDYLGVLVNGAHVRVDVHLSNGETLSELLVIGAVVASPQPGGASRSSRWGGQAGGGPWGVGPDLLGDLPPGNESAGV